MFALSNDAKSCFLQSADCLQLNICWENLAIFVDWRSHSDDQNHLIARDHWRSLEKTKLQLVTTSYIFDEIVTFLNSRGFHSKAVEVGRDLLNSQSVRMINTVEKIG